MATRHWRRYETQIYEKFRSKFPHCEMERDVRLPGRMSGIARQVDIAGRGEVLGVEALVAIECRIRSRKLDVSAVDRFRGFLEDIGATIGIMVTTNGYSEAAKRRAKWAGITLDLVDYRDIDEYEFSWEVCEMCDPGPNHPPPLIDFDPPMAVVKDGIATVVEVGRCGWCDGISVKCWACGETTPIPEHEYGAPLECRGGCGLKFIVKTEYVHHGREHWVEIVGFD